MNIGGSPSFHPSHFDAHESDHESDRESATSSGDESGSSFEEVNHSPLLRSVDRDYQEVHGGIQSEQAVPGGGYVGAPRGVSRQALTAIKSRLLWARSLTGKSGAAAAALPKEKTLSPESSFADMERFIKGIGSEDLTYLKTLAFRAPKHGKETYNLVKDAGTSLVGTATAYLIGSALGLPTGFVFGTQLGDIFSGYFKNSVGVFETGERPLGQEFMQKWVYFKVTFQEAFDNLNEDTKKAAGELRNFIDFCAQDYVKPSRTEELSTTNLDYARIFFFRYAFILAASSLQPHAAFTPLDGQESPKYTPRLDNTLDPEVPYHKRLIHFDPIKREAIRDIEKNLINNADPEQEPGMPVTKLFSGPGGTGKTTLIGMLAEYLSLRFKELSLTAMPIDKLRGSQVYAPIENEINSLEDKVGLLALELVRLGSGILFIDEADALNREEMYAFWNAVLQDKNPVLKVPSLGLEINLSRFAIFFAANIFLTNPPLRQRLSPYPFDGLNAEEKKNAAMEGLERTLKKIERRSGVEVRDSVAGVVHAHMEYMINLDMMRNSGGRVIKRAIQSFCSRLEDEFRADLDADIPKHEIEKKILDIYREFPPEETLDQLVDAVEREASIKYLSNLKNKIQDHAVNRQTIEMLMMDIQQARVQLNDSALLIILSALSGEDSQLEITDPAEQLSALYLVEALSKVSGRNASDPRKTQLGLHECLADLMTALKNNRITTDVGKMRLLAVVRDVVNYLPKRGDNLRTDRVRNNTIGGLKAWESTNKDMPSAMLNEIQLIQVKLA